jgi:hypothetical protein
VATLLIAQLPCERLPGAGPNRAASGNDQALVLIEVFSDLAEKRQGVGTAITIFEIVVLRWLGCDCHALHPID